MLHKLNKLALALSLVTFASVSASLADETSASSTTVSSPGGAASTSVHSRSSSDGTSATHVRSARQDANGISTHNYKAVSGPGGAAQSASHTNVHLNSAGGITATHSKSASATSADGTTSVEHKETQKSTP